MSTELLYLHDAYLRTFTATVVEVDGNRVRLDRTAFYPTGGGQPHDTGTLAGPDGEAQVTEVTKAGRRTPGTPSTGPVPAVGAVGDRRPLDWERRHGLMRTHTALHILCGVIWNEWGTAVTGGNMTPLAARMDFEFDPLPEGFGARVEELVNAEIAADRADRGRLPAPGHRRGRRGPHPDEGEHDPRVGDRDPGGGHRGPRQAGRRRHPRGVDRRGRRACGWSRPSPRARPTSASASR